MLLDADPDFLVAEADEIHLVETGRQQPVAQALGVGLQLGLLEGAGERDLGHGLEEGDALDLGLFRVFRQGLDRGHGLLDVGLGLLQVGARIKLDGDDAGAFPRHGDDSVHVVEKADGGLDGIENVFFHVFRAGAGPGDGDGDHRDLDGREELGVEALEPEEAKGDHRRHEQVRGGRVGDEEADQSAPPGKLLRAVGHRTSTVSPSRAMERRVVRTLSSLAIWPRTRMSAPAAPTSSTLRAFSLPSSMT